MEGDPPWLRSLRIRPQTSAEFRFTEEQQQLRAAVRKFCADNFDEQTVRRLMESEVPFDAKVWNRLGSELGVLGLSVPEADGGVGGSLVDQAVAVEEFGAALACGPLFGTVYLAIPALVACPGGPARDELLGRAGGGHPHRGVRRRRQGRRVRPGGGDSDRRRRHVYRHRRAGWSTRAPPTRSWSPQRLRTGSVCMRWTPTASGVQRTPLVTLDLTRPQADVTFADAPARLMAGPRRPSG